MLPTKASGHAHRDANRSAQRSTSQPTVIQPTTMESFEINACSDGSAKLSNDRRLEHHDARSPWPAR